MITLQSQCKTNMFINPHLLLSLSMPNFGPGLLNKQLGFFMSDRYNAAGRKARMVAEYYSGWLALVGSRFPFKSSKDLAAGMDGILSSGASLSLYMAFGGTNFGFMNGANSLPFYQPHITSRNTYLLTHSSQC